jgi:hypothetical protein
MREQRGEPKDRRSPDRTMSEENSISPLEQYHVVRGQIEHEDNLVSQRLSWLLASQSFLFTAYAITLNGPIQSHVRSFETRADMLLSLLTLVGVVSVLLIWISILAGVTAMKRLRNGLHARVGDLLPEGLPPIQTTGIPFLAGQLGPVLTPVIFIVVWMVLLIGG